MAGGRDPFDPRDVEDIRQRIVVPVVDSLIRSHELQELDVSLRPSISLTGFFDETEGLVMRDGNMPSESSDSMDLWVTVKARGETWNSQIWVNGDEYETLGQAAQVFADLLEQWVNEGFARGEGRIARYVIPVRRR